MSISPSAPVSISPLDGSSPKSIPPPIGIPPPPDGPPSISLPSAPLSSVYSAPGSPYMLSTLSKSPVFLIICIVFCNSADNAVSRRSSSRFFLISLSDHLNICFQAHIIEVRGIPPPGSETASFAVVIFFARFSSSNISACEEGLFIVNVKLFKSSWKPFKYKWMIAILFSSINNDCCILLTVLVNLTSSNDKFLPSPVVSSKFKNDFGTLNAVSTLFCTNLISSIAVRF